MSALQIDFFLLNIHPIILVHREKLYLNYLIHQYPNMTLFLKYKWSKLDTKEKILYDSNYLKYLE